MHGRQTLVALDIAQSRGAGAAWQPLLARLGERLRRRRVLTAMTLAGMAVLLISLAVFSRSPEPMFGGRRAGEARGATAAILPRVEPMDFLPLPQDRARALNASQPFVRNGTGLAPSFVFAGTETDRLAATACLAAAVLYEAGDDRGGQTAVAQVILNRVRHPAFPKTVCGVVFQGSNRATGCQFTFTCDGALGRDRSVGAWERARKVAAEALGGAVDSRVGLATHYHTDWVVPAWSAEMDKVAQVGTHLFFRWRGTWGSAAAFGDGHRGAELVDPRLVARSIGMILPIGTEGSAVPQSPSPPLELAASGGSGRVPETAVFNATGLNLRGAVVRLADEGLGVFVLQLPRDRFSGDYAMASLDLCRGRSHCTVLGYLSAGKAPAALPVPAGAARHASFFYDASVAHAYWDCSEIARSRPSDCIPGTATAQVSDRTLSQKSGQVLAN